MRRIAARAASFIALEVSKPLVNSTSGSTASTVPSAPNPFAASTRTSTAACPSNPTSAA
jgi:hypothetical protein